MPRPDKSPRPPKPSRKSRKSKIKLWAIPLRWLRFLVLIFFFSTLFSVLLFRFVPPPLTPLMAIRYVQAVLGPGKAHLDKSWRPLEKISPRLMEAVVASEDQLFCDHWGFDWEAILSAFSINSHGKRKLGASTITQQTAKNLFLWPERSWSRKALEAYFTLLVELLWSKQRILEVYLNIIETGNGIYGAEAASQKYFHISAKHLDRSQAALIAAILPNPRAWSPAHPTAYLMRRQSWILRQMKYRGPLPNAFYGENQTRTPTQVIKSERKPKPLAPKATSTPDTSKALPSDSALPLDSTIRIEPPMTNPEPGTAIKLIPAETSPDSALPPPSDSL